MLVGTANNFNVFVFLDFNFQIHFFTFEIRCAESPVLVKTTIAAALHLFAASTTDEPMTSVHSLLTPVLALMSKKL